MVSVCELRGGYGVNIFLILSGFGLTYSFYKKERSHTAQSWCTYYKKRVLRIVPTYFLIAILYFAIVSHSISDVLWNLSFASFIFGGKRHFWYILAILICYILFPIFIEIRKKLNFRIVLFGLVMFADFVASLCMLYAPEFYSNNEIALWRFQCFWVGCYFGVLGFEGSCREFYISLGGFTSIGMILLLTNGLGRNTFVFTTPIVLVIFCFILERIRIVNAKIVLRALNYLGRISLELYLVHVSFGLLFADIIRTIIGNELLSLATFFLSSFSIAVIIQILFSVKKRSKNRIERK